ncbi:hypothetical protein EDC04DRAFT_2624781 [Pisolithus marmoratus]|nr:hypothetical protein EDC04DRAFT_2624781 [Pisolithus marmoratus]
MRHSLGYSQGDQNISVSGELPFVHYASAAPAMGLVSTPPFPGHASFQSDDCAEDHYGTSSNDQASVQAIESEVSWPALSNSVILAPQELYLSRHSGDDNVQVFTDPSAFHNFCAETMNTTTFHNSATGMTPSFVLTPRLSSIAPRSAYIRTLAPNGREEPYNSPRSASGRPFS